MMLWGMMPSPVSIPVDKVRARYFTPQDKGLGGFQSPWIRFAPNMSKFELSTESAFQSPWIRFAHGSTSHQVSSD